MRTDVMLAVSLAALAPLAHGEAGQSLGDYTWCYADVFHGDGLDQFVYTSVHNLRLPGLDFGTTTADWSRHVRRRHAALGTEVYPNCVPHSSAYEAEDEQRRTLRLRRDTGDIISFNVWRPQPRF